MLYAKNLENYFVISISFAQDSLWILRKQSPLSRNSVTTNKHDNSQAKRNLQIGFAWASKYGFAGDELD